ncbi:MAG: hypothetical protein AB7S61_09305 [Methanoregulaceae archaeon]
MGGRDREDALSEIIGFVLILALIVVASTLYLMYVVPAEGREEEIEHMNQVKDRFVSYKTSVDGLWLRSLGDLSISGTRGVSLSTSFDLGTGGGNTQSSGLFLSFMRPIGTAARMSIAADSGDYLTLRVDGTPVIDRVPLGSLNYSTDNYYWIQQTYAYEMGGVFLEQKNEGVSVKVAPSLSLYHFGNGTSENYIHSVKLNLCLVNLTREAGTIGGTGPLRVETRLRESMVSSYENSRVDTVSVEIDARNERWASAWNQAFIDAARRSGVAESGDLTDDSHQWFFIHRPDDTTSILEVRNKTGDPAISKDVMLNLIEAPLQVTFEYDEL